MLTASWYPSSERDFWATVPLSGFKKIAGGAGDVEAQAGGKKMTRAEKIRGARFSRGNDSNTKAGVSISLNHTA